MTIKLEISGENAAEFLANARKTLAAFGATDLPENSTAEAVTNAFARVVGDIVEPGKVDIFPPGEVLTTEEPKKRGRPVTKKQEVQEAASEPVNSNPAPATLTIEDLRTRVREIMAAFEKKEYAARAVEKGKDKTADKTVLEASVVYCKQLFAKFGIAKISDLPADKHADFMAESQKYLDELAE